MTETSNAIIGHVMVPRPGVDDPAACLGDENWAQFFDCVEVGESAWMELDRLGSLDAFQAIADGLVGRFEEAWFVDPARLEAACLRELSRLPSLRHALLREIAALAQTAQQRGAVVIFVIF